MNLFNLKKLFSEKGCEKVYVKRLSPNDNSKNQIYLSGSFEILNIFPISEIYADSSGDWKKERFKASINFSWVDADGGIYPAPNAQFILYPKYPEVRFSGFLSNCKQAPSELMRSRLPGRILFLSVTGNGTVLGYTASPDSEIVNQLETLTNLETIGVLSVINLESVVNNRDKLIEELRRIHLSGWIRAKRLNNEGVILPCHSPNCGGYTLEAELGIKPNGYSEPDYLGYELKQFKVIRFDRLVSEVITLMTPEPNGGYYSEMGVESFIRTYGYKDRNGKEDRLNFGGIHKAGIVQPLTSLRLELPGFDAETGKIRNASGSISLVDQHDEIAASWSFSSLIKHWNRKHNQACYVPAKAETSPERKYYYGNRILLGDGTDFQLFLKEMSQGHIYYDPGIKMENASATHPFIKRRSQFRIKSANLINLYHKSEIVDVLA